MKSSDQSRSLRRPSLPEPAMGPRSSMCGRSDAWEPQTVCMAASAPGRNPPPLPWAAHGQSISNMFGQRVLPKGLHFRESAAVIRVSSGNAPLPRTAKGCQTPLKPVPPPVGLQLEARRGAVEAGSSPNCSSAPLPESPAGVLNPPEPAYGTVGSKGAQGSTLSTSFPAPLRKACQHHSTGQSSASSQLPQASLPPCQGGQTSISGSVKKQKASLHSEQRTFSKWSPMQMASLQLKMGAGIFQTQIMETVRDAPDCDYDRSVDDALFVPRARQSSLILPRDSSFETIATDIMPQRLNFNDGESGEPATAALQRELRHFHLAVDLPLMLAQLQPRKQLSGQNRVPLLDAAANLAKLQALSTAAMELISAAGAAEDARAASTDGNLPALRFKSPLKEQVGVPGPLGRQSVQRRTSTAPCNRLGSVRSTAAKPCMLNMMEALRKMQALQMEGCRLVARAAAS